MKPLFPLAIPPSYISLFEKVRDTKSNTTKSKLIAKQTLIRNRFIAYETHSASNTLHNLPASSLNSVRKELRSCYAPGLEIDLIKKSIKNSQPKGRLTWCPYCIATTPSTHDHYMPAIEFPEFAAHALNLVPACSRCNSIKGDDWLSQGARQYLHLYIDHIPQVPFLTVSIKSDLATQAVAANFKLEQAGMQMAYWSLIESHFRKLKLIELYDSNSNDLITESLRSARSHIKAGGSNPGQFIHNQSLEDSDLYGEYSWRAVLLRAMSVHVDLKKWISWL